MWRDEYLIDPLYLDEPCSLSLSLSLDLSLYLSIFYPLSLCHSRIHRICSSSLQQMRPMFFRTPPFPCKQVNVTVIHHAITLLGGEMSISSFLSLINGSPFYFTDVLLPLLRSLSPSLLACRTTAK